MYYYYYYYFIISVIIAPQTGHCNWLCERYKCHDCSEDVNSRYQAHLCVLLVCRALATATTSRSSTIIWWLTSHPAFWHTDTANQFVHYVGCRAHAYSLSPLYLYPHLHQILVNTHNCFTCRSHESDRLRSLTNQKYHYFILSNISVGEFQQYLKELL